MVNGMVEALNGVMPDYEIPADDLVGEVLIPAISGSDEVRIGAGFFSSHCLAKIAPGLAEYLARDGVLRLLASTELSAEDRKAVETGVATPQRAIEAFSLDLLSDARSTLARHAADCLAYLVRARSIANSVRPDAFRHVSQEEVVASRRNELGCDSWLRKRDRARVTGKR